MKQYLKDCIEALKVFPSALTAYMNKMSEDMKSYPESQYKRGFLDGLADQASIKLKQYNPDSIKVVEIVAHTASDFHDIAVAVRKSGAPAGTLFAHRPIGIDGLPLDPAISIKCDGEVDK